MSAAALLPAAGVALLVAWLAGALLRRLASRIGAIDRPDGALKTHRGPVPALGGFAVAAGVASAALAGSGAGGVLAPAAGFLALGALDDRRPLAPATKLAVGVAIALAWVFVARPLGFIGWPIALAAALFLVAVANATNLVDVADALCACVVASSAAALALLLAHHGDAAAAALAAALAGALLGFLVHNFPPARLFLGDGGSLFAGALLGALTLRSCAALAAAPAPARLAPLLLVALPASELLLVSSLRLARGQSPLRGSPDHLVHQLRRLGLRDPAAVAILAALGAGLALLALALAGVGPWLPAQGVA